jgi:hypothetical protein
LGLVFRFQDVWDRRGVRRSGMQKVLIVPVKYDMAARDDLVFGIEYSIAFGAEVLAKTYQDTRNCFVSEE